MTILWTLPMLPISVVDMSRHAPWEVRFWSRVMFLPGDDGCWIWTGARRTINGEPEYGSFILHGKTVLPHRVAYKLLIGPIPNIRLDHRCRCRNKLCVRPLHLRPATHKQNGENLGLARNNASGFRGVHWSSTVGKWAAVVRHHGRDTYAGYFDDVSDAGAAAAAKRNELFTHNELDRAS